MYLATKAWEVELMIELRRSEEEYGDIPLAERARMVCARKLPDWMQTLEADKHIKQMRAKSGKISVQ